MQVKMQTSEFMFKVPRTRRRRSLYCREQTSELKEAWEKSSANSKFASSLKDGRSCVRNLFSVVPAEVVEQDTAPSCDRLASHTFTSIETVHEHGLNLQELSPSAIDSGRVTQLSEYRSDNSDSSFLQPPENRTEPIRDSNGEIFGHEGANVAATTPDNAPVSPDIFLFKDESISADSDDDWESTTPPAPRSPSDHTVPDLSDLGTVTTPSEYLTYSTPFSLPHPDEWSVPQLQDNTQPSMYQQILSLDSMFTDVYY